MVGSLVKGVLGAMLLMLAACGDDTGGSADAGADADADLGLPDLPDSGFDVDADQGGEDEQTDPWAELPSGLDDREPNDTCLGSLDPPPELLSDTGCFSGTPLEPIAALVPYDVRAELWSDGADKERYLALPDETTLIVDESGDIELPPGGVTIKTFALDGRLIETRFVVRDDSGAYHAFSYEWNEEQTDAELRLDGADVPLSQDFVWRVPSSDDCFRCHTDAANISLGLELGQLNGDLLYAATGRTANQLATLAGIGMLDTTDLLTPDNLPALAAVDGDGEVIDRARSYLHANCSFCHRPGSLGAGPADLRVTTELAFTNVCDVAPEFGDPIGGGNDLVTPGEPDASVLLERIRTTDPSWQMPPLARQLVDDAAVEVIGDWIEDLGDCE